MKKYILNLFVLLSLITINTSLGQGIVINEVQSANTTVIADENGNNEDWIELYNNGSTAVNLSGYGLSDDPNLPKKWIFPNVLLGSKQYLLIWASDKNKAIPGSPLHTNFKISSSGETITLTNSSGVLVDSIPAKAMISDISYGRLPNGTGGFVFFGNCTPNAANSSISYSDFLNPPTFSVNSGFFTQGFSLTLSSAPGTTILYTLDGSEPDANNLAGTTYRYKNQYPEKPGQVTGQLMQKSFQTLEYKAPISVIDRSSLPNKISSISTTYHFNPSYIPTSPIFKGTVVRAKVIKQGALPSSTISKSYFISPQGSGRFSLPVISLSTNEDGLFDYDQGINVAGVDFDNWRIANPLLAPKTSGNTANFFRRGKEIEKVTNLTYFVNGIEVLNQDVGLRIHGGSSRVARNRSFVLYARSDYGDDSMSYSFFAEEPFDKYSGIVLHNSGNDYNQTIFRDALCQGLMKSLNVFTKGYHPSIVFINGEYWGMLSLRDKIDDDFFQRVFNIPKSEIDVLEEKYNVIEGDNVDYLQMLDYLNTHSLATQANFDYIKTQLDPENFSDYFISNIFLGNNDWPMNNIIYWRKRTSAYEPNSPYGHDGRWRWLAHDMDDTFVNSNNDDINHNHLADVTDPIGSAYPNPPYSTIALRRLLENSTFKIEFINRFADLLNTSFLSSRILAKMNEMKMVLSPEMPELFARWKAPIDNDDWNYFLDHEINFATQRPTYQRNHIRSKFGIASNINATLNVSDINAGSIKINTIDIKAGTDGITSDPYPWTGIYFSGIPVKIKAIPKSGFTFSHWVGSSTSTNPEITITSTSSFSVTAVFVPETVASSHPIFYWMINSKIKNDYPLETINSTYKKGTVDGVLHYQSCLVGYPFVSSDITHWRKASMERRDNPSDINYMPELNNNLSFMNSDMKGLQIKEPLQNENLENTLIFNLSTSGYKDIKFSFAAINELTNANSIVVDYSVNSGTPIWISSGLTSNTFPLEATYKLFNIDFTPVITANNNPNFKVRLRFTGTNMTADTGARITFNNIVVHGTSFNLSLDENSPPVFLIYPNPVKDILNISSQFELVDFKIFSIDGKIIQKGNLDSKEINLSQLPSGLYMLQLNTDGKSEIKKIIKN